MAMVEPSEISGLLRSLILIKDINQLRHDIKVGIRSAYLKSPKSIMNFGSCLLDRFVQLNWTGPNDKDRCILQSLSDSIKDKLNEVCLTDDYDGECWYELCINPYLLSLANIILVDNMTMSYSSLLWALRCLSVQQQLLCVRSSTLWNAMQDITEKLVKVMPNAGLTINEMCSTNLEISNCFLLHSQYDNALKHLQMAEKYAGIRLELSGALGKRTKFQVFDTALLQLQVSHARGIEDASSSIDETSSIHVPQTSMDTPPIDKLSLPRDVLLEDDTLLSHAQFIESEHTDDLTPIQQAVVLNSCIHHKWTSPVHRLTTEQLTVYVEALLHQPKCWIVQAMSLYMRCLFERKRTRTLERSMMQLQELVDTYSASVPEASQRLMLFYCVPLPPHWLIEKEFADTLVQMGANQGALEVYERLHLWDEVIACCQVIGRHGQAERVIRERMKMEGETDRLWCLLGDATKDHTCYEKAWEVSSHRCARAQKSLGLYHLSKENFKECTNSLQKSVSVNPLQSGLWFTLGHSADKCNDHTLSAHAYQQCVILDPENFEAWNNLAGQYVKLKDKVRAFNAFQEALKCNYESSRVWENYLIVAIDIGEFEEVIRAYHRILDIQRKHLDTEVLEYLVKAVINDVDMRNGHKASTLRKKSAELLSRVTAQSTCSSELWEICSLLHLSSDREIDINKGLIELQKAQRTARQARGWENDEQQRYRVFDLTVRYSKACRTNSHSDNCQDIRSSARLSVQAVVTKLKSLVEFEVDENKMKFSEMIEALSEELSYLIQEK